MCFVKLTHRENVTNCADENKYGDGNYIRVMQGDSLKVQLSWVIIPNLNEENRSTLTWNEI